MKRTILAYFFILSNIIFLYGKTFDCKSNGKNVLERNTVGFYKTTDFPTLLTLDEYDDCNFRFFTTESERGGDYFSSNGESFYSIMFNVAINSTDIDISIEDFFEPNIYNIALQGIIAFDEWIDSCPLESVSKNSPLFIEDENQIIFVQSSYYENKTRLFPCQWQFSAPQGYGFKIYILEFKVSSSTTLFISNSTEIFINQRSAKINYPYYNEDRYIQIYLSKGDQNFITNMEFKAYITIVQKNIKKTEDECSFKRVGNRIIWSLWLTDEDNTIPQKGYKNNAKCDYELIIPKTKAYRIGVIQLCMEENSDYLRYYLNENKVYYLKSHFEDTMLGPYEKNISVWWKFRSDGSFPSLGFSIVFEETNCFCGNPVIPCDGDSMHSVVSYCNNIICPFTIGICESKLSRIIISSAKNIDLQLVSNNMTLTERTNYTKINSLYLDLFLDSANNNILEAVNRNSLDAANLEFSVESFTAPSIDLNITLTLDNPIYILNTKVANFIVVTSAENLQFKLQDSPLIIIYSNAQYGTQVYNNQSLTNNICFLNSSPFICKVHSNKLALLQLYNDELFYLPFLAIQLWGHSKGCVFKENVLILSGVETIFLSKLANDEECAVYVLIENDSHFYISSLWATSNEETIKIFIGDKQNILLLEYNSFSAKLWQTVLLFSPVYKILIPSRASVAITFVGYKDTEGFVLYPSYKSIFASPYYGSTKNNLGAIQSFDYIIGNFTAKFTALSYKTNANINSLYFSTERGKQEQVKKVGDYLLFKNVTVTVIYDASLQPENEAIFLIET